MLSLLLGSSRLFQHEASPYRPLKEGNIRLLSFLDDSGVVCSLQPCKLQEAPQYIALSYTWGQASNPRGRPSSLSYHIEVNGNVFEVQQNLHDALTHLGHRVREKQCLFWVDAICINQGGLDERAAQVRRMKEIYERASVVFAWLGIPSSDERAGLALKLMGHLREDFLGKFKELQDRDAVEATIDKHHTRFPQDDIGQVQQAWDSILELLELPYWERAWVFQEASTPGHIDFFFGDHVFDERSVWAVYMFIQRFVKIQGFNHRFLDAARNVSMMMLAKIHRSLQKPLRLVDLTRQLKFSKCADPRDKVYAAISIATDVVHGQISVDYHRELVDVYVDVAVAALFNPSMGGLEILGYVWTPAEDASGALFSTSLKPQMPSWVPDWRQSVNVSSWSAMRNDTQMYDPCPGTSVKAHVYERELKLKGHVADELCIETLTSIWEDDVSSLSMPRAWCDTLMDPTQSDAALGKAISRSLVGDKTAVTIDMPDNTPEVIFKRGYAVDWSLVDSDRDQLGSAAQYEFDHMVRQIEGCCFGRRMARLTGGRIAVLPAAAKVGDQVAAFQGGKSLYLVRPLPDGEASYTLIIGECYVDGLMDGAFLEACKGEDKPARSIRLV